MLERTNQIERERQRRCERKRRYRQRCTAGVRVYPVEIGDEVITMLIRLRWLAEGDVHDRNKVGCAVSGLLADTVRRT